MISIAISIAAFVLSLIAVCMAFFALITGEPLDREENWDSNEGHECLNDPGARK